MTKRYLLVIVVTIVSAVAVQGQEAHPGNGVSIPVVVKEGKPTYTPAARAAKIEGTVMVDAVVATDGTVGDAHVIRSLDTQYGLDNQALKAVKQWIFKRGTRDGTTRVSSRNPVVRSGSP